MPSIIGRSTVVVEHDGLTITELSGNVASAGSAQADTLSIARVTVTQPTAEPWLTLAYDEWLSVLKGTIELKHVIGNDGTEESLTVQAGSTCFIGKGERFRPMFPVGDTEYIAVCAPSFQPDRCLREENADTSEVTARLRQLHSHPTTIAKPDVKSNTDPSLEDSIIYHMCQKSLWDTAVQNQVAYFPPTFEIDGGFTHATALPERLVETANHFYTDTKGDWICIQLSTKELHKLGIVTRFENPKGVGATPSGSNWTDWACPHIFGGIPTHVEGIVLQQFPMERDSAGRFIGIPGLT